MQFSRYFLALAISAGGLTACGSDSMETPASSVTGSAQLPPTTSGTDVEAWLKKGEYLKWTCETTDHPQIKVSPHGKNRICSNDLIATYTGAKDAERPKGSAAVKELYDDSDTLVGYAVEVKIADTSKGGANWYWYERVPGTGVVADGNGDGGAPKSICVGCHSAAGSDDTHTVKSSSDYVYDVIQ